MLSNLSLSTNEIRLRASNFVKKHEKDFNEKSQSQTFWIRFFEIFGIDQSDVSSFEYQVKKFNDNEGWIDLLWPKVLLVEHKTAGRSLEKARAQAEDYIIQLEKNIRPRYILTCDFQNFHLFDRVEQTEYDFKLSELPDKIEYFNFMRGLTPEKIHDEDPVNIKASELMGKIYDNLKKFGYPKHETEFLLTRLTYCLFADDTGIFEPHILYKYIKNRTSEDGTDLGGKLIQLFQVLNKSYDLRQTNLDEDLAKFPYINGSLFKDNISIPQFDSKMRNLLIEASDFNWSKISPAIFGSLFQSVMNSEDRRDSGSHYTSEKNIMKVIEPLFLDDLTNEFETIKNRKDNHKQGELKRFQTKLSDLKFLDPACGAGNFLIIAYREIRRLELKVIRELHDKGVQLLDVSILSKVDVNQFFGIEINEFSARIAETALWMMDHIMNNELSKDYGLAYARIPLENHPNIINTDALDVDWNEIIPSNECSYIFGNPPFIGTQYQSLKQSNQIKELLDKGDDGGLLDYVCGWFLKAGLYVNEKTPIGFVATNSTTQGQQVAQLWNLLFDKYNLKLNFAYQQFKWTSEARGTAGVTVVILGLSKNSKKEKRLFTYLNEEIIEENPHYISPYLIGSNKLLPIVKRSSKPQNGLTKLVTGTMPIDGNNYLFTDIQKKEFLEKETESEFLFRPYLGSDEFLHGKKRWILNVHDIEPKRLRNLPETKKRIALVKSYRLKSKRSKTKKMAETPTDYDITQIPKDAFLVIPEHSSENRNYIPIGYVEPPTIPSNKVKIILHSRLELFGLLTSKMHNVWNNFIGGKLEKRNIYSIGMVYNTFPIPEKDYSNLKPLAQKILDIRESYQDSTLHDLYGSETMPSDLKKAHLSLDRTVEKLYREKPFESDQDRIEFLLSKYDEMVDKK
jgi:hypothetical protein